MKLDIERKVAALQRMSTGQLCERYAELFGEPTRSRHRTSLIRKIAGQLQALVEGGLATRTAAVNGAGEESEPLTNGEKGTSMILARGAAKISNVPFS